MLLYNTDFNQPIKHSDGIIFLPNLELINNEIIFKNTIFRKEYIYYEKNYIFDSYFNPFFENLRFKKRYVYFSYVLINGIFKFTFFTEQIYNIAKDNNLFNFDNFFKKDKKILNIRIYTDKYVNYENSFITEKNINIKETDIINKEFKIENFIERNSISVKNNADLVKCYINSKKFDIEYKKVLFNMIDKYSKKLRRRKIGSLID